MTMFAVSPDPAISRLVERCGYATAALTVLPIPGSEILGVMPLHVGMVVGIATHHGHELTQESALDLVVQIGSAVGASLVGSRLATTAAKFALPGLGGFIAAPFMFASTLAIGAVADQWFRNDGSLSEADMKDLYDRTVKNAKSSFNASRMKDADVMAEAEDAVAQGQAEDEEEAPKETLTERLARAKEMLEAGLIDDDEFAAVKERILSEI